jgi:putative ABC transport system permease protein
MRTPLAWRNVWHKKVRSLIALCGIAFAILLIFMQLGFYAAARTNATSIYDAFDFDVVVLSPEYIFVAQAADFPQYRLEEVRAVPGVESAVPIWVQLGEWRNPETRDAWDMLALGVEPEQRPFRDPAINNQLPLLFVRDNALSDSLSRPEDGRLEPGINSELQHHRIRIAGRYSMGAGFIAGATLITSRETFLEVFKQASHEQINLGLVKIAPNASPRIIADEIKSRVWPVATALTRADFAKAEQTFWLNTKPVGIMFTTGVLVAFAAGTVILYQVLAAEVQSRLREYATLKALGYNTRFVYEVIVRQALIFSWLGFIPAFFFAFVLYFLLRIEAFIPVRMEPTRVVAVLLLTSTMCLSATFLAIRKLRAADPADLF